jgi:hypothetical protein
MNDEPRPIKKFTMSPLSLSIWLDRSSRGMYYSWQLTKFFPRGEEEMWTKTFFEPDIHIAIPLIKKALKWIEENPVEEDE